MASKTEGRLADALTKFKRALERSTFERPDQATIDAWVLQIQEIDRDLRQFRGVDLDAIPGGKERIDLAVIAMNKAKELLEMWLVEGGR